MHSTSSNSTNFSAAAWRRLSQSTPHNVDLASEFGQLSISTEVPKIAPVPEEGQAPLHVRQQFMEASQRAKATDGDMTRKRRSSLGSESPRRIIEISTTTFEEAVNPRGANHFENMMQAVKCEPISLKDSVGTALLFECNNYGISADRDTQIDVIAESLTVIIGKDKKEVLSNVEEPFTVNPNSRVQLYKGTITLQVNGVKKTYKVHSALIYKNQIFSADATAHFADAVYRIPYYETPQAGCQSFIIADGCGLGELSQNASCKVIDVAMQTLMNSLRALPSRKSTTRDIAKVHAMFMQNVQQALETAGMLEVGATTLTVATVALPYLVVSRLGDCDVFISRKSTSGNRQCVCVTPGSRKDSADAKDPGGSLAWDKPSWRNYSVSVVKLEAFDRIMGFTDGVTDNFDPAMHGDTPRTYSYEADAWDNTNPALYELRQNRLAHRLAKVIQPDDRQQTVEAIITFISNTTLVTKEHTLLTGKKPPEGNYKDFPGKEDHASGFILDIGDFKKPFGSFIKRK
ncbi:MAG: protein phosphatase 2C domain-containing protein [Chlamydiales bacterium]|nr:protein phosphatase 2C domain-containing protein [Chlamydiales bacterium]